jgi:hypothetical protein
LKAQELSCGKPSTHPRELSRRVGIPTGRAKIKNSHTKSPLICKGFFGAEVRCISILVLMVRALFGWDHPVLNEPLSGSRNGFGREPIWVLRDDIFPGLVS